MGRNVMIWLLGLALLALGVAAVALFFIPRTYYHCGGDPYPTSLDVTTGGLVIAVGAAVVSMFIASIKGLRLTALAAVLCVGGATVASAIGVGVLVAHRTAGWGCG